MRPPARGPRPRGWPPARPRIRSSSPPAAITVLTPETPCPPGQPGRDRGRHRLRVVADLVDQAERQRLGRVHPAAGQRQVHGRAPAHQVGQQPGAHRQVQAGRPGPAQPRRRAGDPQVGRGGQLRAAAHRGPGQHRDDRPGPGHDGLAAVVDQVGDGRPFGVGDGQVGPGAEHPGIGAGQQDRRCRGRRPARPSPRAAGSRRARCAAPGGTGAASGSRPGWSRRSGEDAACSGSRTVQAPENGGFRNA